MEAFAFWLRVYWRLAIGLLMVCVSVWLMLVVDGSIFFLPFPVFAYGFSMAAVDEKVSFLPYHARPAGEYDKVHGSSLLLSAIASTVPIGIQVIQSGFQRRALIVGAIVVAFVAVGIVNLLWQAKDRRKGI